jgi:hypothetical protein
MFSIVENSFKIYFKFIDMIRQEQYSKCRSAAESCKQICGTARDKIP